MKNEKIPEKVQQYIAGSCRPGCRVIVERNAGLTRGSKKFIAKHLPDIDGKAIGIMAHKPNGCHNCMNVWTVIAFPYCALVVKGFSFGYTGEGSRGLEWAVNLFRLFNKYPSQVIFEGSIHTEIYFS